MTAFSSLLSDNLSLVYFLKLSCIIQMDKAGIEPNLYTANTVLAVYAQAHHIRSALHFFRQAFDTSPISTSTTTVAADDQEDQTPVNMESHTQNIDGSRELIMAEAPGMFTSSSYFQQQLRIPISIIVVCVCVGGQFILPSRDDWAGNIRKGTGEAEARHSGIHDSSADVRRNCAHRGRPRTVERN